MKVIITDGDRRDYRQSPPIIPSRCGTPCYMEIIKPPDKLVYTNGEAIDITGMKVVAYACDGREWGEVPNEWLTIDPDTAISSDIWTDGDGVNALLVSLIYQPIGFAVGSKAGIGDKVIGALDGCPATICSNPSTSGHEIGDVIAVVLMTRYNDAVYAMRLSGQTNCNTAIYQNGGWRYRAAAPEPPLGRFANIEGVGYFTELPNSTKEPTYAGEMSPVSPSDTVTVSLEYDEEHTFTDTFQITIE